MTITGMILLGCALILTGCASKSRPGDPFASLRRAVEKRHAQYDPGARGLLERSPEVPSSLVHLLRRGDRLRDRGQTADAVWSYLQAMKLDPSASAPGERIGYLELRDDTGRAEVIFEDLTGSYPTSVSAHEGLGLARLASGKLDGAKISFEHALEINPRAVNAVGGLALVHDAFGEHQTAQTLYLLALVIDPYETNVLNHLGLSYMVSDDYDAAVDAYQRALRLVPENSMLHNNLGFALGRLGRYWEARTEFLKAGSEAAASNNLGYVYYLNGRYPQAIRHYEIALADGGEEDRLTIVQNIMDAQDALTASSRRLLH
jgi:Flp pilus assembly protein TadD